MSRYVGRPWRSRFLRAPKLALELAANPAFVPLGDLADVTLGLKTGADSFFFVQPVERVPTGTRFGEGGSRVEVVVRGYNGWEGPISARDMLPVVRNPHELIADGRRSFVVGRRTVAFYLYPRPRAPRDGLADYIERAVHDGVHQTALVRSNADPQWWFRQVRALVRPAWVLPYNSAYDYVAWDNPARAVINGRFVGVEPRPAVDSDLLGAILNSTFVAATRLLEGVATGAEGAYDVGPPAARSMRIPDPRHLAPAARPSILSALAEMRAVNEAAPAPDREAQVGDLRHRLDLAVAVGLGLGEGDAAALVGRLYESYARWRGAVEEVEAAVRVNRRVAHRAGTTRGESPIQSAARRTWEAVAPSARLLPRDLLRPTDDFERVVTSRRVRFPAQTPLFEPGRVEVDGGTTVDLGSWDRVIYLSMLVALGFQSPYAIPKDHAQADAVVRAYEAERSDVRMRAEAVAREFVAGRDLPQVVEAAEQLWMRACRAAGMGDIRG